MELSLDLILTAAMNIVVLIGGAAYIYWIGTKKKSSTIAGETVDPTKASVEKARPSPKTLVEAPSNGPSMAKSTAREAVVAAEVGASPKTDGKEYIGTVKRYSQRNEWGLISCSMTYSLYSSDVRIFKAEFEKAGLSVGDDIAFQVAAGHRSSDKKGRQHPSATGVRRLGKGASLSESKSTLNAGASEFVPSEPCQPVAHRSLSATAAEFVPSGMAGLPTGGLNAAAAEFVPGTGPSTSGSLRADAAVFVPSGESSYEDPGQSRCNWDAY